MSLSQDMEQAIRCYLEAKTNGTKKEANARKKEAEDFIIQHMERNNQTYLQVDDGKLGRRFFQIKIDPKKQAITEEFVQDAYAAFKMSVEQTSSEQAQKEAFAFVKFIQDVRNRSAVPSKKLVCSDKPSLSAMLNGMTGQL